jgi:glycine/D-amino acid oxidase-like deaminating enzyme
MNIAVIGLGGTGSAALRFLADAGHKVTGYERYEIGHRRGSSHAARAPRSLQANLQSTYPKM